MPTVYFLQTHKNPGQIQRLVRRIKAECRNAIVLIYHHKARIRLDPHIFNGLEQVHVNEVQEAERATFSLVMPFLNALDWLFDRDVPFDWIVMLSGQCYPARSLI
ncbi:MAG: hypothetical protein HC822_27465, partial [Oscillochloris sp.]|nr:hypothetical protein [Oscillochloris sp.]